ncbi:MAG: hypothetical protein Kow00103_08120 [Candidatus Caldatribacteriota bacterium]
MKKIPKRIYFIFITIAFFLFLNIIYPSLFWGILASTDNSEVVSSPESVPHTIMVELFVQSTCTTCPIAEFCLEDLAWEYGPSKFILVQEHLWGDGYDTPETNARYDWYVGEGDRGTPDVFINGLTKRFLGLFCDCAEGNYECYKNAIDEELGKQSFLQISAARRQEGSALIIEGTVKNLSDQPLENLAVSGMLGREKNEPGLYNYIQDIFPFLEIPVFSPGAIFSFTFYPEINFPLTTNGKEKEDTSEVLHLVVFVQNLKTKEILQALYLE